MGLRDGKGIVYYYMEDDKLNRTYTGERKENKRDGRGIIQRSNGNSYNGEFSSDMRNGS